MTIPSPRARTVRSPRTALAATLAAATLTLGACATTSQAEPPAADGTSTTDAADGTDGGTSTTYPLTLTDCGQDVTFDAAPGDVMTVGSDAIALLDAAGASTHIAARSGEFGADLPAGLTSPPDDAPVIDPSDPTTEQIIGAGVDVVVGYGFFNADPAALADAGITTLTVTGECGHDIGATVEPVTFDVVLDDIDRFGRLFDTSAVAQETVAELRGRVDAVEAQAPAETRSAATVYYFSTSSPISTYGGAGIIQSVMDGAGLENVYGDEPQTYLEISLESLLDADPEVIVLAYGLHGDTYEEAEARLLAEPGASDLQAVREDRIIGIPANESTASPAAVSGLERLQQAVAELD
ncbi:ABC transporter substrate-binding protein [Oerskovia flava]|uniref:ABC transporter substrate-binding protein n=1 Tax=Oerskovia flava TaxID=2986422 RepID=UPI00223FC8F7|nr:ABC transporter substrate-binding protein [Oerskovia sp. JB1-3-2]